MSVPSFCWCVLVSFLVVLAMARGARADLYEDAPDLVVHPNSSIGDHSTIQDAINAAPMDVPTRIRVHRNVNDWNENIDFLGKPIVLYALDGPEHTHLVGDGTTSVVRFTSGETSEAAIIGFTIRDGGNLGGTLGGGIRIDNGSSPAVIGCHIHDNEGLVGGGMHIRGGNPLLLNCTVRDNLANTFGGGIHLENADPEIAARVVTGKPIDHRVDVVVSNAYALGGGQNASLVVRRLDEQSLD